MVHYASQPGSHAAMPLSFREIADDIARRIAAGEDGYQPGDRLPSHSQLKDHYGVSLATVVRAIALLHDRGLIRGEQGRGLFVAGTTS